MVVFFSDPDLTLKLGQCFRTGSWGNDTKLWIPAQFEYVLVLLWKYGIFRSENKNNRKCIDIWCWYGGNFYAKLLKFASTGNQTDKLVIFEQSYYDDKLRENESLNPPFST